MNWKLIPGDCLDALAAVGAESVQLIVTSPPYADQRKDTYGGVHPDKYVEWFLPRAAAMKRVLRQDGTLIINIKENVVNGQRHTYVIDLIKAMQEQGWLWTEEFIWHKKNCTPGKWPNRFRDAFERCLQFNLQRHFYMDQEAVRVPVGDWAETRIPNMSEADKVRKKSAVGSGFGRKVSNWVGRDTVYPTNVLHLATECSNKGHSAAFPVALPEWFIRLFSKPGDIILDPFSGSGTTGVMAIYLQREYIGIEMSPEILRRSEIRLGTGYAPLASACPVQDTPEPEDNILNWFPHDSDSG